jgi:peptide-methionine (S)-S-oxide reductase
VQVVYDPAKIAYEDLLKAFWENHDPTQGNRQGNDMGSQYRSAIYTTTEEQLVAALASREAFDPIVQATGRQPITTEITRAGDFFYAEDYHQQYLDKNPGGYCPNHATGVKLPDDFVATPLQCVD